MQGNFVGESTLLQRGLQLLDQGQLDDAHDLLQLAYDQGGRSLALVNALAEALVRLQRAPEAIALLDETLRLHPADVQTLCTLGFAHAELKQWQTSVACLERAAALRNNDAALLNNLGNALREAGRAGEALTAFRRAVAINPAIGAVHCNLAGTLLALGQVDQALLSFVNHLSGNPGDAEAYSNLLFTMHYSDQLAAQQIALAHRRFSEQIEKPLQGARAPHANLPDPGRRLRVGYVSSDLREHSVAYFIEAVLTHHDRSRVELFAYANHSGDDAVTARLQPLFGHWRSILHVSDIEAEQMVRADGIDLLIDLNGHTGGNRLPLFARKPAPVQLTWLGYPNTTGLDAMDYRLTDAWADPPGMTEALHSEALWRLPDCFVCYRPPDGAPGVAKRPLDPAQPIRFGSMNNHAKISPGTVVAWSRILAAVPASVLVLKLRGQHDATIRDGLLARFRQQGIAPERLVVLDRVAGARDHLARYHDSDIALDTFPYAGTTTTCDALWMGVPVVTLAGPAHVSRVGVSLLNAVGLGELVASSVDEYVDVATRLALNLPRLQVMRAGLRPRMAASSLTDGAWFTRQFEAALRAMWQRWCQGWGQVLPFAPATADWVTGGAKGKT
jgi:predicted O-linked N-acetylglucosamine transferase (SPINDLY family)